MSNTNLETLKNRAKLWCSYFFKRLGKPSKELVNQLKQLDLRNDLNDNLPVNSLEVDGLVSSQNDTFLFERLKKFNLQMSSKAIAYISTICGGPADCAILLAFISYEYSKLKSESNLITWEWLDGNIFKGNYPNRTTFNEMWSMQIVKKNDQETRDKNLVDTPEFFI